MSSTSSTPGSAATGWALAVISVTPSRYGKRTMASVFATYSMSPISAMPKGEFRPFRNTVFTSATPSPSASRSRVMRLALGTAAPARACTLPWT